MIFLYLPQVLNRRTSFCSQVEEQNYKRNFKKYNSDFWKIQEKCVKKHCRTPFHIVPKISRAWFYAMLWGFWGLEKKSPSGIYGGI